MNNKEARSVTENNIIMICIIIHVNKRNLNIIRNGNRHWKHEENRKVCFSVETRKLRIYPWNPLLAKQKKLATAKNDEWR